ncbi:MAG TPA: aldolase/citrate lyase family protein [Terriglobales bacterium]|jgi:citrate lyase subunit beta/citryl-CoA lyase|nr:aldolase/citrate lyase family protein [Terriglobales bacterium]
MINNTATSAHPAEAGHYGKDVRSDLHVAIEPRDSGGLEITLESRVGLYYGSSILSQTRQVLESLGVKHARISIHDEGALPFVISARIEAAAKRAGLAGGQKALPEKITLSEPTTRDRLRRSRLYLPGSEPKYFINAALHGPDAIILDLEDSVHHAEKDAARILVRNTLRAVDFGSCERMVRINQLPLGLEDLAEIVPEAPDLVLIPKVERPDQVGEADRLMRKLKVSNGIDRAIWLMPILESALGIENAFAIATVTPNVCALTIGLEDYTADLGVVKTLEGRESQYARTRVVNAAKAAGVQAIDSVFSDVGDLAGLRRWGESSRALGFEGMGCIHPSQIPVVHEAFAPTQAEIEKALKIVAAFEDAQQRGLAVVSLGSKMIDPPVVERARRLVARAKAMGKA